MFWYVTESFLAIIFLQFACLISQVTHLEFCFFNDCCNMVNTLGFLRESRTFYSVCCCSWRSNISETSSDSTGIVISVFWLSLFGTNNYHYSFNFWTLWSFAPIIFNNRQSSTYLHGSVFRDGISCLMHCKKVLLSILMWKNLQFIPFCFAFCVFWPIVSVENL